MKKFALMFALVAAVAVPAVAGGSPWTSYESSNSYTGYFYYDGDVYYGTRTFEYAYQWKDNGNNYHSKGTYSWSFEAFDGSFSAEGSDHWNNKWSAKSADTYSSNGQNKYFDGDGNLIEVVNTNYYYTFNANGELTSIHWN